MNAYEQLKRLIAEYEIEEVERVLRMVKSNDRHSKRYAQSIALRQQVIALVEQGKERQEIAQLLNITPARVRSCIEKDRRMKLTALLEV